jgi:hypothetical protein
VRIPLIPEELWKDAKHATFSAGFLLSGEF